MMGKTHKLGGVTAAFGGHLWLQSTGMSLPFIHPIVELAVIYPFAIYGSTAPDLDHNIRAIPSRDPVSLLGWGVLHSTNRLRKSMPNKRSPLYFALGCCDAKHRSWQTHSELTLAVLLFFAWFMTQPSLAGLIFGPNYRASAPIAALIVTGLALGQISHIVLDGITKDGVPFVTGMILKRTLKLPMPTRIRFVPENSKYFKTGEEFEDLVNKVLRIVTWVLCFLVVLTILFPEYSLGDMVNWLEIQFKSSLKS